MSMKNIIGVVQKKVREFKILGDTVNSRKFSTYLLAMITYLRQCIVCSIIPIASIAIDMTDFKGRSELSKMLNDEIDKLNLKKWLDNIESVKSTRFKKTLDIIDKHSNENIVIFTCFRTCLEVFETFLPKDRNIYTISSNMTSKKRSTTLEEFGKPNKNGLGNILLLTYDIGAEGLNLQQISNTVLLLDFFWNDGKTSQAVARVLRYGQKSEEVNIYYMTSNSAVENAIFEKQNLKLQIISELETGKQKTTIKKMRVQDIIKIINTEDNINVIKKINIRR
jgi:SNF2 family DNA or RNA helicase